MFAMNRVILKLLGQRIALALLSLLAVSVIVFSITAVLPGDAAQEQLGQDATPEAVAALRAQMGLDVPAPERYAKWLFGMLKGDPGLSATTQMPVADLVASRLPNSLLLAAVTALFSVPIALTLGIASAVWRGSWFDRIASTSAVAVVSVPEFLVATLAVLVFAVKLRWLPALSFVNDIESLGQLLRAFAMPVMVLCCVIVAQMMRMTRAAVIDQLEAPYIEMVRLKGASPMRMVLAHALPNAVGPIANAVALSLSYLLGGVIIVETIFNYPGIAKLMVDGVSQRDMPLVQTCAMIFCCAYLILVTTADIFGILANPRLRHR
jgi:peptide/nickel transport system permease protein